MNILITGYRGMMGRNLSRTLATVSPDEQLFLIDDRSTEEELASAAACADFVFHLLHNEAFTNRLIPLLEGGRKPPVWMPCGQTVLEETMRAYGRRNSAQTCFCCMPAVFGKWGQPNEESLANTLCYQIARGLPADVPDPCQTLEMVYVDDVVQQCLLALQGMPENEKTGCCRAEPVYVKAAGELAEKIRGFHEMRGKMETPDQSDPFTAKLYAAYLSYLPEYEFAQRAVTHADHRGSFTELLRLGGHGQVSLNIMHPHISKGDHWHQTKHEKFIVLSGEGIIRFRRPEEETVISYRVNGEIFQVVDIPPGYTHSIENTGDTDMMTLMWVNEMFDPSRLDTCPLPVIPEKKNIK